MTRIVYFTEVLCSCQNSVSKIQNEILLVVFQFGYIVVQNFPLDFVFLFLSLKLMRITSFFY